MFFFGRATAVTKAIAFRDMNEYNNFLMDKLAKLANIGSVQSHFVLSEGKTETAYPLTQNIQKEKGK
ncbi:Lrp/AsnC ligand binding domain-containing protein [Niastella vici]|uniref:Lrp/AsnC ligand binding domain-containing protein n=1 Tax=Niastella vici TaxID=1703345 RepID=UPI0021D33114|nr:Lrp/AsnC ligand binding domain-containing protein [Niastella vici]